MKFLSALIAFVLLCASRASAQQPWTAAPSPTHATLWGVTYGRQFVAVGETGSIVTSADGSLWSTQSSGTGQWLLAVTWVTPLGLYVAVGDGGTIVTSPDGVTWTARPSGTSQRLNSVAWAPKAFSYPVVLLAVGENGTAVVSYDGITWAPRTTGENGWLRGLTATGTDSFVVTGHDGTLLTTTNAGDSFVRRDSGTSLSLDAATTYRPIGVGGGIYATGANFVFTQSSDNGATWIVDHTVDPSGAQAGVTYNGLTAFNSALVIVGDAGRILDEFGRPWTQAAPLATGWRAVAASATRVVAVGTAGGIASAPIDPTTPGEVFVSQTTLGNTITLNATQRRSGTGVTPSSYQWALDGVVIPNATTSALTLSGSTAHSGTYTVTANYTPIGGAPFSTSASMVVNTVPVSNPAILDPTFVSGLQQAPKFLVPAAGGKIYAVGGYPGQPVRAGLPVWVVRLNVDGSVDRGFNLTAATSAGTPTGLVEQPDGRVILVTQTAIDQTGETYTVQRFRSDGSVDPSFTPDPLMATGATPILLADGRWLVPDIVRSPTTSLVLRRFSSNGARDTTFTTTLLSNPPGGASTALNGAGARCASAQDAQGRTYVSIRYGDSGTPTLSVQSGKSAIFRLLADGTPDASFTTAYLDPVQEMRATPAGLVVRTLSTLWGRIAGFFYQTQQLRLAQNGTIDPTYHITTIAWHTGTYGPEDSQDDALQTASIAPDGSIIARVVGRLAHYGLVRFDPNGAFDRDFAAEIGGDASAITQVTALSPSSVLLTLNTTTPLGTPSPYVVRVLPNLHASTTYLSNISARARTDATSGPLILGFVTQGGSTTTLIRGAGPALASFGVTGYLTDPQLALFSGTAQISANDNWSTGPVATISAAAGTVGAFPFASGSGDAAMLPTTTAGAYTAQVSGQGSAAGVGLAEIYLVNPVPTDAGSPRIANFSVRTRAGNGADTLIAGFAITGTSSRTLLIRGVGAALAAFGVSDALPDPVLTVYGSGNTSIATNDDWGVDVNAIRVANDAFKTVGAFALPYATTYPYTSSKDAVLLLTLPPGSYTAQVTGKNGATGSALIELYEVP